MGRDGARKHTMKLVLILALCVNMFVCAQVAENGLARRSLRKGGRGGGRSSGRGSKSSAAKVGGKIFKGSKGVSRSKNGLTKVAPAGVWIAILVVVIMVIILIVYLNRRRCIGADNK